MFNRKNLSIYYYYNFKKKSLIHWKWNYKKININKKVIFWKNLKYLKIINTCLLTGKKKSVLNKNKINRHFVRELKKNDYTFWSIKMW